MANCYVLGEDFGITPEVQSKLDAAAALCRQAFAEIEAALNAADEGTDAENRCNEALDELDGVLLHLEWTPTKEIANG